MTAQERRKRRSESLTASVLAADAQEPEALSLRDSVEALRLERHLALSVYCSDVFGPRTGSVVALNAVVKFINSTKELRGQLLETPFASLGGA
jgi:hypothetical protein